MELFFEPFSQNEAEKMLGPGSKHWHRHGKSEDILRLS
jgi:hypothetical protein